MGTVRSSAPRVTSAGRRGAGLVDGLARPAIGGSARLAALYRHGTVLTLWPNRRHWGRREKSEKARSPSFGRDEGLIWRPNRGDHHPAGVAPKAAEGFPAVYGSDAMRLPRRRFLHLAAVAAALPAASRIARGQAYPTRPIRLVIPFPPGGAFDAVGRPWAEKMKPLLGTGSG